MTIHCNLQWQSFPESGILKKLSEAAMQNYYQCDVYKKVPSNRHWKVVWHLEVFENR